MIGIQLHNSEEEIVGTVLTENPENFDRICLMWDEYVKEYKDYEDIHQFEDLYSNDIFFVVPIDFYQPKA